MVRKSIEEWAALADYRLRGTGVRCFSRTRKTTHFFSIDAAMQSSYVLEFAENRLIQLDET